MAQGIDPSKERPDTGDDPFQRQILRDQLDRVAEEKRKALEDPGPSWGEWFYQSAAKWWVGLAFFILDAWLIVECLDLGSLLLILPTLAAALYAEFLLYRVLWYIPTDVRRNRRFRRSWFRPVPYGRWTAEAEYYRAHPVAVPTDGPSADDFL
ncbi:MAG TPA: hypothetical protein VMF04_01565 [Thermoplasmata archaeon]|nr:hypothetical protein [Thermoplasmata archaeon]